MIHYRFYTISLTSLFLLLIWQSHFEAVALRGWGSKGGSCGIVSGVGGTGLNGICIFIFSSCYLNFAALDEQVEGGNVVRQAFGARAVVGSRRYRCRRIRASGQHLGEAVPRRQEREEAGVRVPPTVLSIGNGPFHEEGEE